MPYLVLPRQNASRIAQISDYKVCLCDQNHTRGRSKDSLPLQLLLFLLLLRVILLRVILLLRDECLKSGERVFMRPRFRDECLKSGERVFMRPRFRDGHDRMFPIHPSFRGLLVQVARKLLGRSERFLLVRGFRVGLALQLRCHILPSIIIDDLVALKVKVLTF